MFVVYHWTGSVAQEYHATAIKWVGKNLALYDVYGEPNRESYQGPYIGRYVVLSPERGEIVVRKEEYAA